jgi:hypothetical protein
VTPQNPSEGERLEKMLKNEAKALLKSVKADDREALHRVAAYFKAPKNVTLQQVQLVVAREHGLESWNKLKSRVRGQRQPAALNSVLKATFTIAFQAAKESRHKYFSVEHALLALLEIFDVVDVLSNVGCDLDLLRGELVTLIENRALQPATDTQQEIEPGEGFKRVMQTAVWHVQLAEKEVSAINVLVSIYSHESSAADLLNQQVARMDVVDYLMSNK